MAGTVRFVRDEIFMGLGVIIAGIGGLALLGFALDPDLGDEGAVPGLILSCITFSGGVAIFFAGYRLRRLERRLGQILDVLRSVQRSTVLSVADAAGLPLRQTRKGVFFLIGRGFVPLRYDAEQDLVYAPADPQNPGAPARWARLPGRCPTCHAPTPYMAPAREAAPPRCEYCDHPLPFEEGSSPDRPPSGAERPAGSESPPGASQIHESMFTGSWGVMTVLFLFCWPLGVAYLIRGLVKSGAFKVH
jgi:hypothetical protein